MSHNPCLLGKVVFEPLKLFYPPLVVGKNAFLSI
jgi:hypothetical protein